MERHTNYVVCISDRGDELSVIKGKLYRVVEPDPHDPEKWVRIIDETGDDYPYDRSWFAEIDVPDAVAHALEEAA